MVWNNSKLDKLKARYQEIFVPLMVIPFNPRIVGMPFSEFHYQTKTTGL